MLPELGNVGILCITDKQFGCMEIFHGKKLKEKTNSEDIIWLELF